MSAEVHHGDALELAPELGEFDAVITDPPFPTGGESSMKDPASIKEAREMVDGLCQSLVAGVLRAVRWRSEGRCVWLHTDWRQVSFFSAILRGQGFVRQSCIVWDKGSGSMSSLYHPSHEMVLFGCTNAYQVPGYLGRDLIQCKRVTGKARMHPFDKPPELVEDLLSAREGKEKGGKLIRSNSRILDPFCGAGSLLVGAQRLGWDVVGIDISREFVEIAKTRLGNGSHEPARAKVEGQGGLL